MKLSVKKGDTVLVLTGKDKGAKGKVISVDPTEGRVTVENVNIQAKHKKPRSAQDTGGIIKKEGSIDVSNVQLICPSCGKNTRVGHMTGESGKKIRSCKKCGSSLDVKIEKTKKSARKSKKADENAEAAEVKTAKKKSTPKSKKEETTASASKKRESTAGENN